MLKRRHAAPSSSTERRHIPGSGAAIYQIDGRLLIRTVDGSDHLGIERDDLDAIDNVADATTVGKAIVAAVDRAVEIPRPRTWPTRSEYAAPLLNAGPRHYRSYRSWQRAARHVSAERRPDGWHITRMHPDLNTGSWHPTRGADSPDAHPLRQHLPVDATPTEIGAAVLACLEPPPLAG